jgi:hypothetical protein
MGSGDSYHPKGHHTFKGLRLLPSSSRWCVGRLWHDLMLTLLFCRGLEPFWWLVVRSQGMEA